MAGSGDVRVEGDFPVGRLAPSPTGLLHLGHARSFLIAWWNVRAQGGVMRLRIEDLDAARARPELVDQALRDLEWLGLDWDGTVVRQSEDLTPYEQATDTLLASGAAYPCVCSRKEIEAAGAPHANSGETRYPGTCRGRFGSPTEALEASGRAAGVRLRVADGGVTVRDTRRGDVTVDVAEEVGDFLLARRDGVFAYQLAVVVDDARMGVTEVVRGDDLLTSTPRQWLVQRALSLPHPDWIHLPLVHGADGERLAKRDGAFAMAKLREEGVDGRAVVTWAARSAGQIPEDPDHELVDAAQVAERFDLARVPDAAVTFGAEELEAVRRWRA